MRVLQSLNTGVKVGRGIAEAVLAGFGANRLNGRNHNPAPLVVVMTGNNRTGAYSLAAGRWLSLRGIRVLAVLSSSEEDELEVHTLSLIPMPTKSF
jgi:YjeF-related protein N-terminus